MAKDIKYTVDNIYEIAGKELTTAMLAVIGTEEDLIKWFYEPNKFYKNKSPYELCIEGEISRLEKTIMDILTAAHGG